MPLRTPSTTAASPTTCKTGQSEFPTQTVSKKLWIVFFKKSLIPRLTVPVYASYCSGRCYEKDEGNLEKLERCPFVGKVGGGDTCLRFGTPDRFVVHSVCTGMLTLRQHFNPVTFLFFFCYTVARNNWTFSQFLLRSFPCLRPILFFSVSAPCSDPRPAEEAGRQPLRCHVGRAKIKGEEINEGTKKLFLSCCQSFGFSFSSSVSVFLFLQDDNIYWKTYTSKGLQQKMLLQNRNFLEFFWHRVSWLFLCFSILIWWLRIFGTPSGTLQKKSEKSEVHQFFM